MHMACAVEGGEPDPAAAAAVAEGGEEVTFLYRLTAGGCPKSYGTNVARLAGLPRGLVARAAEVSAAWAHPPAGGAAALRALLPRLRAACAQGSPALLRELQGAAAEALA